MFRNDRQRLSISVLNSTVFETFSLLETASLLCVFPLRTSTTIPGFWSTGGLLHRFLTLVSLHFTPLAANELQHLFLTSGADGFLGPFGRDPESAFPSVRASRV